MAMYNYATIHWRYSLSLFQAFTIPFSYVRIRWYATNDYSIPEMCLNLCYETMDR